MPAFLIPFLIRAVFNALSSQVVTHSSASDFHQKAANAHQSAGETAAKLLTTLEPLLAQID